GNEGVLVADANYLVEDLQVNVAGDEIFAYTFDLVGLRHVPGVYRPFRIYTDDFDVGILLFEIAGGTRYSAARTDPGHEVSYLAVRCLPDLRTCRQIVGLWIVRVGELVGLERPGNLQGQPVGH